MKGPGSGEGFLLGWCLSVLLQEVGLTQYGKAGMAFAVLYRVGSCPFPFSMGSALLLFCSWLNHSALG